MINVGNNAKISNMFHVYTTYYSVDAPKVGVCGLLSCVEFSTIVA